MVLIGIHLQVVNSHLIFMWEDATYHAYNIPYDEAQSAANNNPSVWTFDGGLIQDILEDLSNPDNQDH